MVIAEAAWRQAVDACLQASHVALACHIDPDGDALGSMLALRHALEAKGIACTASFGRSAGEQGDGVRVPRQYRFLPGIDTLASPARFPRAPEVMVAFDAGSPERLGELAASLDGAGTVVVMDHHANGSAFGDVRLVDPAAAATAVVVDMFLQRAELPVDTDIATCLYTGLVTDTGRFQYANTTPEVLHMAARLVASGIDHTGIARRIWETHRFGYLKLLGTSLQRAVWEEPADLVWTTVLQDDLRAWDLSMDEAEGVIDVLRSSEPADTALVLKEQPDGQWKASLRSKGARDVGRVASALGGGGHTAAAGFSAAGDAGEIVRRVCRALAGGAS